MDLVRVHRSPTERVTVDLHCVTKWSKLDTTWEGVSLDTLLADAGSLGGHALFHSYGGYTTNLPMEDVTRGKTWVAFRYDGEPLVPEYGGPARLLVPHLYFWKSAKWVLESPDSLLPWPAGHAGLEVHSIRADRGWSQIWADPQPNC